jgi:hypothetical protein
MANNYLQFSVAVDINPDKVEELKAMEKWLKTVTTHEIEEIDELKLPDHINNIVGEMFEQIFYEHESCGFETTIYESEYYVYAEECGDIDLATEWLYALIRLEILKPKTGYVVFTWAETCSKPRPDEFAGGAAIICHHGIKFQDNAWDWAFKQYKEMCHAA